MKNTHKGCTLTAVNLETLAFPLALFRSEPGQFSLQLSDEYFARSEIWIYWRKVSFDFIHLRLMKVNICSLYVV